MRRTLVCMATSRIGPPRPGPEPTLFEAVGGVGFFERLVAAFYRRVEADSLLLGLYPDPTATPHWPRSTRWLSPATASCWL